MQLGQGRVDLWGGEDLVQGVDVVELRVGVVHAVGVVDAGYFREVLFGGAVFLHVFSPCVSEHLCRPWGIGNSPRDRHHLARRASRTLPVLEVALQATAHHLLEPDDQHAVRRSVGDEGPAHVQARGSRGAVVVDVVDGDLGHAELVEDTLAAGGVAVAVAGYALVYVVVRDLCVEQGLDTGFEAELCVVNLPAGLDEFGHAHA